MSPKSTRRQVLRRALAATTIVLSGCNSYPSLSDQESTREEEVVSTQTSQVTSTTMTVTQSATTMLDPQSLIPQPFTVGIDEKYGSPVEVISIGSLSQDKRERSTHGVWIVNQWDSEREILLEIKSDGSDYSGRFVLESRQYLGVALLQQADCSVSVSGDVDFETTIPSSMFDCNERATGIFLTEDGVSVEEYSTDTLCSTPTVE